MINNEQFFAAVNEDAGFEYVKDPENHHLVKTRDSMDSFIEHQELSETGETSYGTIWTFNIPGSRVLMVMSDGEFRYCWKD